MRTHPEADASLAEHPTAGLTRDELHELGEKKVNGRQIKNVVRTATALASSLKEPVGYKHLNKVLDMMDQFEARFVVYFSCYYLANPLYAGAICINDLGVICSVGICATFKSRGP